MPQRPKLTSALKLISLFGALLAISACKVLTLEEDQLARSQRSGSFDAVQYVDQIWPQKINQFFYENSININTILDKLKVKTIDTLNGRQAGEGSPYTFITSGNATVTSIDNSSRQGTAELTLDSGDKVQLLIGPVVFSTSVRDALPFISFNDFANQIVYADVGNALTAYALNESKPALDELAVDDKVKFSGVFALYSAKDTINIIPTALEIVR